MFLSQGSSHTHLKLSWTWLWNSRNYRIRSSLSHRFAPPPPPRCNLTISLPHGIIPVMWPLGMAVLYCRSQPQHGYLYYLDLPCMQVCFTMAGMKRYSKYAGHARLLGVPLTPSPCSTSTPWLVPIPRNFWNDILRFWVPLLIFFCCIVVKILNFKAALRLKQKTYLFSEQIGMLLENALWYIG